MIIINGGIDHIRIMCVKEKDKMK